MGASHTVGDCQLPLYTAHKLIMRQPVEWITVLATTRYCSTLNAIDGCRTRTHHFHPIVHPLAMTTRKIRCLTAAVRLHSSQRRLGLRLRLRALRPSVPAANRLSWIRNAIHIE